MQMAVELKDPSLSCLPLSTTSHVHSALASVIGYLESNALDVIYLHDDQLKTSNPQLKWLKRFYDVCGLLRSVLTAGTPEHVPTKESDMDLLNTELGLAQLLSLHENITIDEARRILNSYNGDVDSASQLFAFGSCSNDHVADKMVQYDRICHASGHGMERLAANSFQQDPTSSNDDLSQKLPPNRLETREEKRDRLAEAAEARMRRKRSMIGGT